MESLENTPRRMQLTEALKRDIAPYIKILSNILATKPIKQIVMLQDGSCHIDYGGKSQVEIEIEKTIFEIEEYYNRKINAEINKNR